MEIKFGLAKMGKISHNRTLHFHPSTWSDQYLAEISKVDWCLYWNKSFYHHLHSYFRKRVKQVSKYGHVWTCTVDILCLVKAIRVRVGEIK